MVKFIPVRYARTEYPHDIKPKIQETAANFFRKTLEKTELPYLSLHTDPARRWKKATKDKILSSELLHEFPAILNNMFHFEDSCVSKLWYNKEWSKDFSGFLIRLTEGIEHQWVKIIEVHPPFDTYCNSLETFLERYAIFEEEALKEFPSAIINIENRCNTAGKRKCGKFLLSTNNDIIKLSKLISKSDLKLKLVVDIPQLFTEHYGMKLLSKGMIKEVLAPIRDIRDYVSSTHIWGNKKQSDVHNADLNAYFNNDQRVKDCFLQEVCQLFDDDKARYFVPEVGGIGSIAVQSIVNDLRNAGIVFVEPK